MSTNNNKATNSSTTNNTNKKTPFRKLFSMDDDDDDNNDDEEAPFFDVLMTPLKIITVDTGNNNAATDDAMYRSKVLFFSIVFFLSMVGHELALEAATTEFASLSMIAYWISFIQFGFCLCMPLIVTCGRAGKKFPNSFAKALPYVTLSLVVFGSTALASEALLYVTYPTKVVFKSAKLIPTMMVSTLFFRDKHYNQRHYIAAFLICLGAMGFALDSKITTHYTATTTSAGDVIAAAAATLNTETAVVSNSSTRALQEVEGLQQDLQQQQQQQDEDTAMAQAWPGLVLLTIAVICDALVPNLQKKFMSPPLSLSAMELMVNVNAVGFLGVSAYLFMSYMMLVFVGTSDTTTTNILPSFHSYLLFYLVLIGLGISTAIWAYTQLLQLTGSVTAVTVATLRKVVTIVLSYVVFPNKHISQWHILAGIAVLTGIVLSNIANNSSPWRR